MPQINHFNENSLGVIGVVFKWPGLTSYTPGWIKVIFSKNGGKWQIAWEK